MRKLYVFAIVFVIAVTIGCSISNPDCYPNITEGDSGMPLPEGNYVAEHGSEWMLVADDVVRIGRDKSSFSVLSNKTNVKLFDKNDLSYAHPQYLRTIDNDTIEWTRKASGPSPQYKIIFRRK